MSLYAPIVKSLLVHMGIRTENIAVMPAISRTDSEVAVMTNEQMQNENSYLGEQVDIYKEGYEISKEKINKLEAKLEAYKEILRSVLKEKK